MWGLGVCGPWAGGGGILTGKLTVVIVIVYLQLFLESISEKRKTF